MLMGPNHGGEISFFLYFLSTRVGAIKNCPEGAIPCRKKVQETKQPPTHHPLLSPEDPNNNGSQTISIHFGFYPDLAIDTMRGVEKACLKKFAHTPMPIHIYARTMTRKEATNTELRAESVQVIKECV